MKSKYQIFKKYLRILNRYGENTLPVLLLIVNPKF